MGTTNFDVVKASAFIGGVMPAINPFGNVWFVDGSNGGDGNSGKTPDLPFATIQNALDKCSAGDTVVVFPKSMGATDTDPNSYAETLTIDPGQYCVTILGVGGRAQGGLPQVKKGSGTTALLTIQAPGCRILNMGFNGSGSTGGGILLDDDGGSTKTAFGTEIAGCHFKNCKGATATDARTGGAIQWPAAGNSWQVWIHDNVFYKNVCDVLLKGTSGSRPQDVIIQDNTFMGLATSVDCHLYLAAGSGMASVSVMGNTFADVLPALSSGSITRYVDMTGCTGIFADNYVGGSYTTTGFGAAKAAAKIPTTVGITHNYSDAGLIVREA